MLWLTGHAPQHWRKWLRRIEQSQAKVKTLVWPGDELKCHSAKNTHLLWRDYRLLTLLFVSWPCHWYSWSLKGMIMILNVAKRDQYLHCLVTMRNKIPWVESLWKPHWNKDNIWCCVQMEFFALFLHLFCIYGYLCHLNYSVPYLTHVQNFAFEWTCHLASWPWVV